MDLINVLYPPLIPSPPSPEQLIPPQDHAPTLDNMAAPSDTLHAVQIKSPSIISPPDASLAPQPNNTDPLTKLPAELGDMIYDLVIGPVIHPFRPRALQPKPERPSTALPLLCVSSAWNDDVLQFIMRTRRIEFEGLASFARFLHRSSRVWIGQAPAVLLRKAVVVCDASDFGLSNTATRKRTTLACVLTRVQGRCSRLASYIRISPGRSSLGVDQTPGSSAVNSAICNWRS